MPFARVVPVVDPSVRALCVKSYPLHPRGCPNFGKKAGCPPATPLLDEFFDLDGPCYVIWNVFDFGAHVAKMRAAHPAWSERQLSCCLYWQGTARKALDVEIDRFRRAVLLPGVPETMFQIDRCPEAKGLDVTATMVRFTGLALEWPPRTKAVQVAFAARRRNGARPLGVSDLFDE